MRYRGSCNPHPHNFTDRMVRPGDQAFFDVLHAYSGYRTCYYRTFNVGRATDVQEDAYKQCREWIDASIDLVLALGYRQMRLQLSGQKVNFGFSMRWRHLLCSLATD